MSQLPNEIIDQIIAYLLGGEHPQWQPEQVRATDQQSADEGSTRTSGLQPAGTGNAQQQLNTIQSPRQLISGAFTRLSNLRYKLRKKHVVPQDALPPETFLTTALAVQYLYTSPKTPTSSTFVSHPAPLLCARLTPSSHTSKPTFGTSTTPV
jgi:hypothetical protein